MLAAGPPRGAAPLPQRRPLLAGPCAAICEPPPPPRTATRRRETELAATAKQKDLLTNQRTESRRMEVPLPSRVTQPQAGPALSFAPGPPQPTPFTALVSPPPARRSIPASPPRPLLPGAPGPRPRPRYLLPPREGKGGGGGGGKRRKGGRAEWRGAAPRPLPARPRRAAPPGVTARHPGEDGKRCQVL